LLACLGGPVIAFPQDNVTIPKSRLEELERKEKELEALKKPVADSPPQQKPQRAAQPNTKPATTEPVVAPPSPPLATLPPPKDWETVEAMDLVNYYRQDKAAADLRFRNRKVAIRGQITAFDKPLLRRDYYVLLETADRDTKVICNLIPPDKFKAVFTINHGSELVGLEGETRIPIVKVGQTILVRGVCKGFKEGVVSISGRELLPQK
jgi:hypothetical protein